jgi:hypothetical protein
MFTIAGPSEEKPFFCINVKQKITICLNFCPDELVEEQIVFENKSNGRL